MRRLWNKLTPRHRLLAVVVVLGMLVALKYANLPLERLPLPENIRTQERQLLKRRRQLAELQAEREKRKQAFAALQQAAEPFWQIQGKTPAVEVPSEFAKLARQAQVKIEQVGAPRSGKVLDLNHVREVEFSVRLTASMREVSRLMAQMERDKNVFYWSRCNIRPDNKRDPKAVVLTGQIRVLVLTPEASKFLGEGGGAHE